MGVRTGIVRQWQRTPLEVPVLCQHNFGSGAFGSDHYCHSFDPRDHIHQPPPCENGQDERHHAYTPPRSVTLLVAGQKKRVRLAHAHDCYAVAEEQEASPHA